MRIGCGYDSHCFTDGDHVMIGGIKIPYSKGVKAHSDGDVLLHAIGDALLGAAALGDLGRHFPDTDDTFRDIRSSDLLEQIVDRLIGKGYQVGNVDTTVITEQPKLLPHIEKMRTHIASVLHISIDSVNVKATTNEKMGWIGRGEGLAAQAVVLLI